MVQVDPYLNVVKGRGGALLREKVSAVSQQLSLMAAQSRCQCWTQLSIYCRRQMGAMLVADGGDGIEEVRVHCGRHEARGGPRRQRR